MPGHAFRAAVEARDIEAALELLADDVVFRSPAVFKPYEGKETVATILRTVFGVFEELRYTDELAGDGVLALVFRAKVGGRDVKGIDILRFDADGLIDAFPVMVRPLSATLALRDAMGRQLGIAES